MGEVVLGGGMSIGVSESLAWTLRSPNFNASLGASGEGSTSAAVGFSGKGGTMVLTGFFLGVQIMTAGTGTSSDKGRLSGKSGWRSV